MNLMEILECPHCGDEFKPQQYDDGLIVQCPKCNRSSMMHSDSMIDYGMFYYLLALPPKKRSKQKEKQYV